MYLIGAYKVHVKTPTVTSALARLEPAEEADMPTSSQWSFNWKELWKRTDFENQYIIKLSYNNILLGLLRYDVYSNEEGIPYGVEILQLESVSKQTALVAPVGKWLVWYATQVALTFCFFDKYDETLVNLDSLEDAISYYKDIIEMKPLGWVTIAPGEDGYAFEFDVTGARYFCERQKTRYGYPERIYP